MMTTLEQCETQIASSLTAARQQANAYRDRLKSSTERDYATWVIRMVFEGATCPSWTNLRGNSDGALMNEKRAKSIRTKIYAMENSAF